MHRISILLSILALGGCDYRVATTSRTTSESVAYSDASDQERFKQALSSAGIPFDVVIEQRGQESVRWDASYSAQVDRIKDSLLLPSGRNLRLDPQRQSQFKAWLEKNTVPYRTIVQADGEYVVWEEADAERVRAWPQFPAYYDNPPASPRQ
jgi:hypothetical protein